MAFGIKIAKDSDMALKTFCVNLSFKTINAKPKLHVGYISWSQLYFTVYLVWSALSPHIHGQQLVRVSVTVMLPCAREPSQGTPVKSHRICIIIETLAKSMHPRILHSALFSPDPQSPAVELNCLAV